MLSIVKELHGYTKMFLLGLILLGPLSAHGQGTCNRPSVFFVNGVWNKTWLDAQASATELNNAISASFMPVNVRTIFNPGDGTLADLAEVAITQNQLRTGLDLIVSVGAIIGPLYSVWLQKEMDAVNASDRRRAAIDKIKAVVLDDIKNRQAPVVLIAHSQGNILVNEAVDELKTHAETRHIPGVHSIAVLGIGVADKRDLGLILFNGNRKLYRYITSDDDRIINPLTGELPANFRQTGVPGSHANDKTGHMLIDSYLSRETLNKVYRRAV